MSGSALWFVGVLLALPTAWWAGRSCATLRDPIKRAVVIGGAVLMLLGWAALIRHPAVAVQVFPVAMLARIEGIGAAPLFVFILGVGWHLATFRRQRAVTVLGLMLGAAYFLQGGLWMMQPTPTNAFEDEMYGLVVPQTQDYSCVPAASATALRMLGLRATEAEMAELTETRAGTGATLLRALNGIDQRLKHTGIRSHLIEADYEGLMRIQPPMLTPVRYEAAQLHMITILDVRPHLIVVADPQTGVEFLSRYSFNRIFRGQVIAFDGEVKRARFEEVMREHHYVLDPDRQAMR